MPGWLWFAIQLLLIALVLFVVFQVVLPWLGLSAVWFAVSLFLGAVAWGLWTLRKIADD